MQTYRLKIGGMGCEHCLHAVRQALEALEGVDVLEVSMGSALVALQEQVPREKFDQAIDDAGYDLIELAPT